MSAQRGAAALGSVDALATRLLASVSTRVQRAAAALLATLAMSAPAWAHSDSALGFRMVCSEEAPFPYWLDGREPSVQGVPLSAAEAAATSAHASWQDVACASTTFRYEGRIATAPDTQDAVSVTAIWVTRREDPAYALALSGGAATAAAVPLAYSGRLYQCDVFLNAVDRTWSTASVTPQGAVDLQTHLLHEAGHCQGLGHSADPADVMHAVTPLGAQRRALTAHDMQDLCALYPQAGAVGSPCDASGACANSLTCVRPPMPDGGQGAALCTRGCTPGPAGCPAPFACVQAALVAGATHACLPADESSVTQVGKPCEDAGACGAAAGICLRENAPSPLPSGAPAWLAGYCTQACSGGAQECPAESACVQVAGAARCLKTCRPGTGDCRPGYACATPLAQAPAVCVPACATDADCAAAGPQGATCRTCDGVCLARQNATALLGDVCTADGQCGTGQSCLFFGSSATGVCASLCGHVCAGCPLGFACRVAGVSGEPYCLRDCAVAACPAGLRCEDLGQARVCLPRCTGDFDCAVGDRCQEGECINPFAQDAGLSDGGTGSSTPRGCGCEQGPTTQAVALWLAAVVLLRACTACGRRQGRSVRSA